MKKHRTITLVILLILLLFGGYVVNASDPGGSNASSNVNRFLSSGGGTGTARPWGEARITVARANTVRQIEVITNMTGQTKSLGYTHTNFGSLSVGTGAQTRRVTANRMNNVTTRGSYFFLPTNSSRWESVGDLSRSW